MGLKLYKIISRPPKVFRQYVFDEIPDNDFLQKSFDFRDTFFWDTRYDIREPRYEQIKIGYQIAKILFIG